MAIEILDLPIEHGGSFHNYVIYIVYQRVLAKPSKLLGTFVKGYAKRRDRGHIVGTSGDRIRLALSLR
jgi:hypothetical protein